MSTYLTHGFVLRVSSYRDNDRLYTVYSREYGKFKAVAAGSQKIGSKLAPHLLPFATIDIMAARGRTIDRLASANVRKVYLKPPYHLPTIILAGSFLEIVDTLTRDGQTDYRLFDLLDSYLSELATLLSINDKFWREQARTKLMQFIIEVLHLTGLMVYLNKCDICGQVLNGEINFSWTRHGFLHKECTLAADSTVVLPNEVREWLSQLYPPAQKTARPRRTDDAQSGYAGRINPWRLYYQPANLAPFIPNVGLVFLTDYLRGQTGQELRALKVLKSVL